MKHFISLTLLLVVFIAVNANARTYQVLLREDANKDETTIISIKEKKPETHFKTMDIDFPDNLPLFIGYTALFRELVIQKKAKYSKEEAPVITKIYPSFKISPRKKYTVTYEKINEKRGLMKLEKEKIPLNSTEKKKIKENFWKNYQTTLLFFFLVIAGLTSFHFSSKKTYNEFMFLIFALSVSLLFSMFYNITLFIAIIIAITLGILIFYNSNTIIGVMAVSFFFSVLSSVAITLLTPIYSNDDVLFGTMIANFIIFFAVCVFVLTLERIKKKRTDYNISKLN